jgi:hypothetical protein
MFQVEFAAKTLMFASTTMVDANMYVILGGILIAFALKEPGWPQMDVHVLALGKVPLHVLF